MKRLTHEILQDQGFLIRDKIVHSEFNRFLSSKSWNQSKLKITFYLLQLFFSGLLGYYFFSSRDIIEWRLLFMGIGILLALLLVPFHEYIHYLTYRRLGAKNVTITPYFRQCYVLTRAHHFVVGKEDLKWIALLPFVVISATGFILLLILDNPGQIAMSTTILFHATLCQSDFRILDYFRTSPSELLMCDDLNEGVTYIYSKH